MTHPYQPSEKPVAWYLPADGGDDSMFRDAHTVKACTGNPWIGWIPLFTAPQLAAEVERAVAAEHKRCIEACECLAEITESVTGQTPYTEGVRACVKTLRRSPPPAPATRKDVDGQGT